MEESAAIYARICGPGDARTDDYVRVVITALAAVRCTAFATIRNVRSAACERDFIAELALIHT